LLPKSLAISNLKTQNTVATTTPSLKTQRSDFVACPECRCPTPIGELARWSVCAFCMSKRWGRG
jgi:predicted nucleic acid-binding Zn ribbon protein